jgi:hypothetical protein
MRHRLLHTMAKRCHRLTRQPRSPSLQHSLVARIDSTATARVPAIERRGHMTAGISRRPHILVLDGLRETARWESPYYARSGALRRVLSA